MEKKMKTKAELRAEAEAQLAAFQSTGGSVERVKERKPPKVRTANAKNKGGRVFSDPTARFPKR